MFLIHLKRHELKEKSTEHDEKQRRKFSKQLEVEVGPPKFQDVSQWSDLEKVFLSFDAISRAFTVQ